MNALARSVSTAALCSLATLAIAQAPIVRQPPASDQSSYTASPTDSTQSQPPDQQPYGQQPYDQQEQAGQQGQADQPPPPLLSPDQLDALVNRIALYPDPLLAQTLTASTYWDEIADAAAWANQHSYIKGDALNAAIEADNLPWDPSVLALLPFPSVLNMMASDADWTGQLGNAVLDQPDEVMDSIQHLRGEAYGYGYLSSNSADDVIDDGDDIQIQPFNPFLYYVPEYDPTIVFAPPRFGFFVGGALRYNHPVSLGPSFGRFGWFGAGFSWGQHALLIDHRPWTRSYANRNVYVAPLAHPYVRPASAQVERHETQQSRPVQQYRGVQQNREIQQNRPSEPSRPAQPSRSSSQQGRPSQQSGAGAQGNAGMGHR
jgi:hypothetical protein